MKILQIRSKKGGKSIWVMIGFFLAAQVFFTIQTSSAGATLSHLEEKAENLRDENKRISQELVVSTSLSKLGERSEEMGFSKSGEIVYLDKELNSVGLRK